MFKIFKLCLLTTLVSLLINNYVFAVDSVELKKKINNEILTNLDIIKETNYLTALNTNLKKLSDNEIYEIAEESLIRETIKKSEIQKFFNLADFKDEKLINNYINSIFKKLNFNSKLEFESYLEKFNLKIEDVEKKISIEILWNQLVSLKYKDKISINKNDILNKIKNEKLKNKELIEYELSEIVIQPKNQKEFSSLKSEISVSIDKFGFETTANKFSVSDTANLGGYIGSIKETQLSDQIRNTLIKLKVGEFTNPINLGSGFVILYINNKKRVVNEFDENIIMENMINFEKNKQFENFSQIYFNKIKLNTNINDF